MSVSLLREAGLVPDVLTQEPQNASLKVTFSGGEVSFGNKLTIEQVSKAPLRVDWNGKEDKFYTLCFTDPDAPSRHTPTVREWVHWLVVNIPGSSKDPSKGETLVEFVPSCPGEGSGVHRYTFVLFEQPSKLDFSSFQPRFDKSLEHRVLRRHFSIQKFAEKYGLGIMAFSANFFTTEWGPYVNEVRKALGMV